MYRLRWLLTRPLQFSLWPCLSAIDLPILRSLPQVTVGQFILTFPLIALFIVSYEATFVDPAKTSGYMATNAMLATVLLANKSNSVLSFLFGMSYERVVPMHRMAALLTLLLTCFHARVAFVNTVQRPSSKQADSPEQDYYSTIEDKNSVWEFLWDGKINITGTLAGVCMALLVSFGFFRVLRQYRFDFWLVSHIVLSLFGIAFCIAHKGYNVTPAAAWWALDWFVRKVVMATYGLPRKASVRTIASGKLVELRMSHFRFRAGQFTRIAVPELGTLFFHPFTISSAPSDLLHIKPVGDWTRRLLELCRRRDCVEVLVEGPYGGMSMDLDNDHCYPIVLCLAGGIGVTPCRSIVRQLLYDEKRCRQLTKVHVVWALRDFAVAKHLRISHSEGKVVQDEAEQYNCTDEEMATSASGNSAPSVGEDSVVQHGGILVDKYADEKQGVMGKKSTSIAVPRLQTDIFLTRVRSKVDESEVFPQLDNCNIHLGRPDVSQILAELAKLAIQDEVSRVAVICCGPKTLIEQTRDACRAHHGCCGGADVLFDLHEEVFEY